MSLKRQNMNHVFPKMAHFSATLDFGTVSSNSYETIIIDVPSARLGDTIIHAILNTTAGPLEDLEFESAAVATGEVVFRVTNPSGGNIDAGLLTVTLLILRPNTGTISHLGTFS